MYTGLLKHNGRLLYDAFLVAGSSGGDSGDRATVYVDVDAAVANRAAKHLSMFLLRKPIELDVMPEGAVAVAHAFAPSGSADDLREGLDGASDGRLTRVSADPRWSCLGWRVYDLPPSGSGTDDGKGEAAIPARCQVKASTYRTALRLAGVAEGRRDLRVGKDIPLEWNLEWLSGVSFAKGCYLGQELTARTHFQGKVRKRAMPFVLGYDPDALLGLDLPVTARSSPAQPPPAVLSADVVEAEAARLAAAVGEAVANPPPLGTDLKAGRRRIGRFGGVDGPLGIGLVRQTALETNPVIQAVDGDGKDCFIRPYVPLWWPHDDGNDGADGGGDQQA